MDTCVAGSVVSLHATITTGKMHMRSSITESSEPQN